MKNWKTSTFAFLASCTLAAMPALAQTFDPPKQAPWGKPADNKILAQKIVNQIMAENPDLISLGFHSIPPGVNANPGEPGQVIIAQVHDRIGAPDGDADLIGSKQNMIRIFKSKEDGMMRMRYMADLRDSAGRDVGLAVLIFKDPAITTLDAHIRADKILTAIAQKIPNQAALFSPVP
jgi:hypothetical protein